MLVPTVRSIPFTAKWLYGHASFIQNNEALRVRYLSVPRRKLPGFIEKNLSAALLPVIRNEQPDLVHFNWLYPDGLAIPAVKQLGIPTVLTIHGSDWYKTGSSPSLRNELYSSLLATDAFMTVGRKLRDDILETYPEFSDKAHVIFNPVDFTRFQPAASRKNLPDRLKWAPEKQHILCVANISHEKGVDVLIETARQIDPQKAIIHIIGNIPGDRFARTVVKAIQQMPNMILHPPVSHDEIVLYYQACDMLVLPSRREGFGLSLAEAIACGKPVVSTKSGGPEDIITVDNGFLVDIESPGQLADKITAILSGSFSRTQKEIRSTILDSFDSDKILDHIYEIYTNVLQNKS